MKTNLRIMLTLAVLVLVTTACSLPRLMPKVEEPGSDGEDRTPITETQKLDSFTEIEFRGGGTIYLEQAEENSIKIEGSKTAVEAVKIEIRNGRLLIDQDRSTWQWLTEVEAPTFTISFSDLSHFKLEGGAIVVANDLKLENLSLEVSGGASLSMDNFFAESIVMDIEGGISVEINGEASRQELNFSGGIDYKAEDFKGEDVKLKMEGAGSAILWASETLDLDLSGAYNVEYYGKPRLSQNVQGIGNLEALGEK